jgi:hypothetical protein
MIAYSKSFGLFDVETLYQRTLYNSQNIRPWAIDERGKYIGLELRKDFVLAYLKGPSNFNFKETRYFEFIKNGQKFSNPNDIYEGNRSWRYAKPDLLCKRYINLIERTIHNPIDYDLVKFYEGQYNLQMSSIVSIINRFYFEFRYPTYVIYNNTHKVRRKPEGSLRSCAPLLRSLITRRFDIRLGHFPIVSKHCDVEIVTNGCHRLAIMYALGIRQNKFKKILCYRG